MTNPQMPQAICVGQRFEIDFASPTGVPRLIPCQVAAASPKAIQIRITTSRGSRRRLWLPRRAITNTAQVKTGAVAVLAGWFKPNDIQAAILADVLRHSETPPSRPGAPLCQ